MKHKTIIEISHVEFDKEINQHLSDGWRLDGDTYAARDEDGMDWFCRSMILEETVVKPGDVVDEGPGYKAVAVKNEPNEDEVVRLLPSLDMTTLSYEVIYQCPGCIFDVDGEKCSVGGDYNCGKYCPHRAEGMPF